MIELSFDIVNVGVAPFSMLNNVEEQTEFNEVTMRMLG
jgi:hypothetical protein